MPSNGNGWNRNREGSIRDTNYNDYRNGRNRNNESDNDWNDRQNERGSGNQGNDYSNPGYGREGGYYGQGREGYNYGEDSNRGDNDYSNRGSYGNTMGAGRGSSDYLGDTNWSSRSRGYSGSDYGSYNDRYNQGRRRNSDRDWWDRTKDEVSSWFGDDDADRRRRMDEQQGQHKGKGPKGYTRSDERIKEDVNDTLSDDPQVDASNIDVTVSSCEVTLTGTVNSRWEKRRAEDIVEAVSGVKNVENRLRVGMNQSNETTGSSGMGARNTGTSASSNRESSYNSETSSVGTSDPRKK